MKYKTHEGAMLAEIAKLRAEKNELLDVLNLIYENLSTTDTGNNVAVDDAYHAARNALAVTK